MSKIEVTEAQAAKLDEVWRNVGFPATRAEAYTTVANELVAMGLVRPASDDHDAHFKELWESIEGRIKAHDDLAARVAAVEAKAQTPDPHAAAKERAKLWGVELVECEHDATWLFMTKTHILLYPAREWTTHWKSDHKTGYCAGFATPYHAWSNFPTEPPPGWEAKRETIYVSPNGNDANDGKTIETPKQTVAAALGKPRTEADRLGEVLWDVIKSQCNSREWPELAEHVKALYRRSAHAVRKAVLAGQLEPSEEEVKAALDAWNFNIDWMKSTDAMRATLIAVARVRLEKAEGEQR